MTLDQIKYAVEIAANIATIIGATGLVFLFAQHFYNRDIRNLQLMHRCIDNFRKWFSNPDKKVDFFYLELLNEELFYFQKGLIQKAIAIEWIEGILDYILVSTPDGFPLNNYNKQVNIETLDQWANNRYFFSRIFHFTHTGLNKSYELPGFGDTNHSQKKRMLAEVLYKHIKEYKY